MAASGLESIARWLAEAAGVSPELVKKVVLTVGILVGYAVGRRLVASLLGRSVDDRSARYRVVKAGQLLLLFLSFIVLGRVWLQDASGLGTWLGLLSAGVAVSLQDPLENLAGWVYIATSRPFRVGDRIQIGEHAGDVLDVHPFSFTLLEIGNWVNADQSTGRLIHVPNGWLFKYAVAGYDQGFPFIWNEISVTVTFESDWRAAKAALEAVLDEHAEKIDESEFNRAGEAMHIQFSRVTPVVWTDTAPEGVRLTMRYLCRPRARRVSASEIWEAILDAFEALSNVDLAYPTTRRFDQAFEGKPALRAAGKPPRPPPAPEIAQLAEEKRVE
ncbi:MAG: mechanosensitive ion channel family protein [Myxococcales bacterium]|nr:mechanosensitive ion channel family protein [Myxococcales bacterium]